MQEAIQLGLNFRNRIKRFEVDLSNSTLVDVLLSYQAHRRKKSPNYSALPIINSLRKMEQWLEFPIMPDEVTDLFYDDFINYLQNVNKVQNSTIKNYCGVIRTALQWGSKHHCPLSSTYDEYEVKVYKPFTIALTADEVSHIAHFDVSTLNCRPQKKKALEQVRDTFVLQTNLYQRFSDIQRITKDNFEDGVYKCTQKKTDAEAMVEINRECVTPELTWRILEKYDYTCPYKANLNNYNSHLHYLLSHIGGSFDDDVSIERKEDGEVIKIVKKKWQVIASHCSRRTAATLAAKRKMSLVEIRKCTGHSGRSTTLEDCYIKADSL